MPGYEPVQSEEAKEHVERTQEQIVDILELLKKNLQQSKDDINDRFIDAHESMENRLDTMVSGIRKEGEDAEAIDKADVSADEIMRQLDEELTEKYIDALNNVTQDIESIKDEVREVLDGLSGK